MYGVEVIDGTPTPCSFARAISRARRYRARGVPRPSITASSESSHSVGLARIGVRQLVHETVDEHCSLLSLGHHQATCARTTSGERRSSTPGSTRGDERPRPRRAAPRVASRTSPPTTSATFDRSAIRRCMHRSSAPVPRPLSRSGRCHRRFPKRPSRCRSFRRCGGIGSFPLKTGGLAMQPTRTDPRDPIASPPAPDPVRSTDRGRDARPARRHRRARVSRSPGDQHHAHHDVTSPQSSARA